MLVSVYKTEPGFETKSQIYRATKELLKASSYDKITVNQICKAVGISRTKFYRNFYDKYAIILWLIDFCDSLGATRIGRDMSLFEGYYITNMAVFEERNFYRAAFRSSGFNPMNNHLRKKRYDTLVETVTAYKHVEPTVRLLAQVECVSVSECYLFNKWITQGHDYTPESIAEILSSMYPKELAGILGSYDRNPPNFMP